MKPPHMMGTAGNKDPLPRNGQHSQPLAVGILYLTGQIFILNSVVA